MDFSFKKWDGHGIDPCTLIFAKIDSVFSFNYETGQIATLYKYKEPLNRQPMFFLMDTE